MYENITYPTNLEKQYSSYVLLTGRQWGTKYKSDKTAKSQTLNNEIYLSLPIPANGISDNTSHNWEAAEGVLLNISKGNIGKMAMKGTLDKVKSSFGNMVAAQQFSSGKTINDYAALNYGGQGFRQFEFEFEMTPDNQKDALKINKIIDVLKIGSLPQNEGYLVQYPFFWRIEALKPNGESYLLIKKCVINNLSVNMFTDIQSIHTDGEPTKTIISIGFSEIEKQWRNDYS
jgi:hypothetical protein